MRAVIADDHPVVRIGIGELLRVRSAITLTGSFESPGDLVSHLKAHACDLLITDLSMPQAGHDDGVPMIQHIRVLQPQLLIIVLTLNFSGSVLEALRMAEVPALVDKCSGLSDLNDAIDAVINRKTYISDSFRRLMALSDDERNAGLDAMQWEMITLLMAGTSFEQLGWHFSLSDQDVRQRILMLVEGMGFFSLSELMRYIAAR